MRILSFFVNYGESQSHYLNEILNEFDKIENVYFENIVFCTHLYDFKQKNVNQILLPQNIGKELTLQPYIFLTQNKDYVNSFDYISYNENDNFISKDNLNSFIYWNSYLEKYNKCCGFIRYEINKDGFKYIVDPIGINDIVNIDGVEFFTIENNHSGCWIFSRNQYKEYIEPNIGSIGYTLEDRATNVYKSGWPGSSWGIEKLFPLSKYKELLIHHMPNKYTHIPDSTAGKLRIENLINK